MAHVAFIALALLAVLRIPAIRRGGAGTLSELALLTGAGAIFMVGTVVPLHTIDSWLGGINLVNLLQNVLATLAIWFMTMTATNMAIGSWPTRRAVWELSIVIVAFSIPFFIVAGGPTDTQFIRNHSTNPWMWMYASIYMAYVAYLMVRMFIALGRREPRPYVVVRVGAVLMVVASVIEIVYLTGRLVGVPLEWLGSAFTPMFYAGILLIVGGLALFPLARLARNIALAVATAMLRRASTTQALVVVEHIDRDSRETLTHSTYRLAVQLADVGNTVELTRPERWSLKFATHLLNLQVPAPREIRMSAVPAVTQ